MPYSTRCYVRYKNCNIDYLLYYWIIRNSSCSLLKIIKTDSILKLKMRSFRTSKYFFYSHSIFHVFSIFSFQCIELNIRRLKYLFYTPKVACVKIIFFYKKVWTLLYYFIFKNNLLAFQNIFIFIRKLNEMYLSN